MSKWSILFGVYDEACVAFRKQFSETLSGLVLHPETVKGELIFSHHLIFFLFHFSIYIEIFLCISDTMFNIIKEGVWGKRGNMYM